MTTLQKVSPRNQEAERALLGALLRGGNLGDVRSEIGVQDFHGEAHRLIYGVIVELHIAGIVVDVVTVAESLYRSGDMEEIGGPVYLADLYTAAGCASLTYYCRIIRDHAIRRQLLELASSITHQSHDLSVATAELLDTIRQKLDAIGEPPAIVGHQLKAGEVLDAFFARLIGRAGQKGAPLQALAEQLVPHQAAAIGEIVGACLDDRRPS